MTLTFEASVHKLLCYLKDMAPDVGDPCDRQVNSNYVIDFAGLRMLHTFCWEIM